MAIKFVTAYVFIYVVGSLLGLVMEMGGLASLIAERGILNTLLVWQQIGSEEAWGTLEIVGSIPGYFGALWKCLIWDFAFLDTPVGDLIKWIIWSPIVAGAIWGFLMVVIAIFQRVLS